MIAAALRADTAGCAGTASLGRERAAGQEQFFVWACARRQTGQRGSSLTVVEDHGVWLDSRRWEAREGREVLCLCGSGGGLLDLDFLWRF